MDRTPLMPKATAVWLVENALLSASSRSPSSAALHVLEVKGIADGDVAHGIKGMDPDLRRPADARGDREGRERQRPPAETRRDEGGGAGGSVFWLAISSRVSCPEEMGSMPLMPCATSPSAMPFTSRTCKPQNSAICSKLREVLSTSQTAVALGMRGVRSMDIEASDMRVTSPSPPSGESQIEKMKGKAPI